MYSAEEIDALLAHFGDAASISADLKDEVAFAFDMGLTQGNDYGNVSPLANMTRIQGAAFLIRAQALVPPAQWTAAKIELVSADKTEGLIGQIYSVTFEVTDAAGHPAKQVLVDFDSLGGAEYYVGNVTQQALMTNNYGQVTVDLISLEPGTQRVSASVVGVGTIYTTRYWLVLDEVYNLKGFKAQNNVGVEHEWGVRVVVFGPGPRSTSQNDWYNAIDAAYDPTNLAVGDGVDATCESGTDPFAFGEDSAWTYADELTLAAAGYTPRTMAGIDVEWAIVDQLDDPTTLANEAYVSVGDIIAVDGVAITPARTAVGKTDAAGYSSIKVYSEVIGKTYTEAIADYPENPYPEQLFFHETFQDWQEHYLDWEDQPKDSEQVKTWIGHTIGGEAGPISPAYDTANIGEELTLTITLVDTHGNPVVGKSVEWFMQGVGFFQTDDAGDTSDKDVAANNKDFDVTDAAGKATLFVKSYDSGEQIIHAKVRDKGIGGAEGTFLTYTAEVQWFDADIVTFDNPATNLITKMVPGTVGLVEVKDEQNEALSTNPINTEHEFCLWVYGLKQEYAPTTDYPDGQTPFIDSDAAGSSYDGIIDAKDAAYFGGILMWPCEQFVPPLAIDEYLDDKLMLQYEWDLVDKDWADDKDNSGKIEALNSKGESEVGTVRVKVNGQWLTLSFEGAYTNYDWNADGAKEPFDGTPGIYLPLEGKTVAFSKANTAPVVNVGSFTPASAVTDAAGKACATVSSATKGLETIKGVVDWPGNPHDGLELLFAHAAKTWKAGTVGAATDVTVEVWMDGVKVADSENGVIASVTNPMWDWVWDGQAGDGGDWVPKLNSAHIEVHVVDGYGNDLPDYEVVYYLESINEVLGGSQNAVNTRIPFAYLVDGDIYDTVGGINYDQNGPRPDADEPHPDSDPYAYIVGPYDPTDDPDESFFFNQWLGSEKGTSAGQAGVHKWWTKTPGWQFDQYITTADLVWNALTWPQFWVDSDMAFDGFDGYLGNGYNDGLPTSDREELVGLATDGAKAWTLDGWAWIDEGTDPDVNLLTGSNIDIQLAEGPGLWAHYKSILRVVVYAPADGLVVEGTPIFSEQVHKIWEVPEPTTVKITPETDYAIAGIEEQSFTATVLDQFGNPYPGVVVKFDSDPSEGVLDNTFDNEERTTNENGNCAVFHDQALGNWGVESLVAYIDLDGDDVADKLEPQAKSVIQWILVDNSESDDDGKGADEGLNTGDHLIHADMTEQKVIVDGIPFDTGYYEGWNNHTLKVYLNPGAAAVSNGYLYVEGINLAISTFSGTWAYIEAATHGDGYFVHDENSKNDDGNINWIWDRTGEAGWPEP